MISFDQFRHAINEALAELQAQPSSPTRDASIATLQALLAGLPAEALDS